MSCNGTASAAAMPSGVVEAAADGKFFPLPVWARREFAMFYTGLPQNVLYAMVADGRVRARKVDPAAKGSACLFRLNDILDAIDEMPPPNGAAKKEQT